MSIMRRDKVDEIINMEDMSLVFNVTDSLGIDRENISVPLGKETQGSVRVLDNGEIKIILPVEPSTEEWCKTLMAFLVSLGYEEENEQC